MDYEKKYKNALEWAKQVMNGETGFIRKEVEDVFPELAESKDEEIRKALISMFKHYNIGKVGNVTYEEIITWLEKQKPFDINDVYEKGYTEGMRVERESWLEKQGKIIEEYENKLDRCTCESFNKGYKSAIEKQGEQKHDDTYCKQHCKGYQETGKCFADGECKAKRDSKNLSDNKVKFKVGDWIITYKNHIWCVDEDSSSTGYLYRLVGINGKVEVAECEIVEEHSHLWTIQDAKDGDVLSYVTDEEDLWIMIYWSLYEPYEGHVHYHALLVNDNFGDKGTCCICIDNLKPATKEQRDLLFSKMKEAGYAWDSDKKELKKIEDISKKETIEFKSVTKTKEEQ